MAFNVPQTTLEEKLKSREAKIEALNEKVKDLTKTNTDLEAELGTEKDAKASVLEDNEKLTAEVKALKTEIKELKKVVK